MDFVRGDGMNGPMNGGPALATVVTVKILAFHKFLTNGVSKSEELRETLKFVYILPYMTLLIN